MITFAAPPDAVAAMLGDGTFWERAGEQVGALHHRAGGGVLVDRDHHTHLEQRLDQVRALFANCSHLTEIAALDLFATTPRYREQGLTRMMERVYGLRPFQPPAQ